MSRCCPPQSRTDSDLTSLTTISCFQTTVTVEHTFKTLSSHISVDFEVAVCLCPQRHIGAKDSTFTIQLAVGFSASSVNRAAHQLYPGSKNLQGKESQVKCFQGKGFVLFRDWHAEASFRLAQRRRPSLDSWKIEALRLSLPQFA